MKSHFHRIHELMVKYRKNHCSRSEYDELIQLAQISGNDQIIKELMKKDWESYEQRLSAKPINEPKRNQKSWQIGLKIAASLTILVTAGFLLFQWFSPNAVSYSTGNGEVKEITLPDGSAVTLNANSNLTWVPSINKRDDRLVKLKGEAFFKVVKEKIISGDHKVSRGFQVQTPKMTVNVLGTSFNVAAREENTAVFLKEGSVELELPEHEDVTRMMIPGDKVVLDNHTGIMTEAKSEDLATSASWVTGILNYHDKSVAEVLQNLSDLFGVLIVCEDPGLQAKQINLGVPYRDWDNTRRALEMAIEVEFLKEGDRYTVVQSDKTNK